MRCRAREGSTWGRKFNNSEDEGFIKRLNSFKKKKREMRPHLFSQALERHRAQIEGNSDHATSHTPARSPGQS